MNYPNVITGHETVVDETQPMAALVAFYKAFNQRNLAAMGEYWAQSPDVVMSNPLGGVRKGWQDIEPVYRNLFTGPAQVYVEFYDFVAQHSADMYWVAGRERGYFQKNDTKLDLHIRTSRLFRNIDGIWKQVHHHGSIEYPMLLKQYQIAVLGHALSHTA